MLRLAIAAALTLAAAGAALADPITARDGAGTVYQLNDDGTYAIVVTGEDGKTYLLSPGGSWFGGDEAAALLQRFDAFLETAFARPDAPKLVEGEWPEYKACLVAAFQTLPITAQRIIVSGSDPRDAFTKLQAVDPDSAKLLDDGDKACRKDVKFQ
jgi:hypothetical protein